jgi:cellulose synthase operon protein C
MKAFPIILIFSIILLAPLNAQNDEKDLFARAEARFDAGQYSIALDLYSELLAEYPLSDYVSDVQYRRAVSMTMLGLYDDALSLFKRIETAYRGTRFIRFLPYWNGIIMYHKKEYARAIESFAAFLKNPGTDDSAAQAYYYKGLSEIGMGSNKDAALTFSDLEKKFPAFKAMGSVRTTRMYLYLQNKEYDALFDYASRINLDTLKPADKEAILSYQGDAYIKTGAFDKAEKIFEPLFRKDSEQAYEAFVGLLAIAKSKNDFSKIEALASRAEGVFQENDPRMESVRLYLGIEYYRSGNYELAKYNLLRLWNLRNTKTIDAAVPSYLAESYIKTGDYKAAFDVYTQYGASLKAPDPRIDAGLGYVYLKQKKYKEAIDKFKAVADSGLSAITGFDPYYYLAYAYYLSGNTDEAIDITDRTIAQNKAGSTVKDFYKLKILLLEKTKEIDKAIQASRDFSSLFPDDTQGRVELVKMLLAKKDYAGALREAQAAIAGSKGLAKSDPYSFFLLSYLQGLSQVGVKAYKNAADTLSSINRERLDGAKLGALYPSVLFYRAWSVYKLTDYKGASRLFLAISDQYPSSSLYAKSLYLAGWCQYSSDDFEAALKTFSTLSDSKAEPLYKERARFFKAKSLLNLKLIDEAKSVFKSIYTDTPKSSLAADALFEYAGIASGQGRAEEASASFGKIASDYAESPLAEESLYRRAESFFSGKLYAKAKSAFYDYRVKYPKGKLLDASLYWGGIASFETGEKALAVLLWEKIINELPGSSFRANALIKAAEYYSDTQEYSKSLSFYAELVSKYKAEADSANASEKAATLKYLVLGLGKKEAELLAAIDRNSADKTPEGRKAMVGLAKLYMTEFGKDKLEAAYATLQSVAAHKEDVDASSDAQYLIAEYFAQKGDYVKAGNEFVKAAVLSTNDRDRMAHSIYRAAEMMKKGGNKEDALSLVDRLEKNFPQSDWTTEGKKLVEGLK